jgi:hypothetical protein
MPKNLTEISAQAAYFLGAFFEKSARIRAPPHPDHTHHILKIRRFAQIKSAFCTMLKSGAPAKKRAPLWKFGNQ